MRPIILVNRETGLVKREADLVKREPDLVNRETDTVQCIFMAHAVLHMVFCTAPHNMGHKIWVWFPVYPL